MRTPSRQDEKTKEKVGVINTPAIRAGQVAQVRVRHALDTYSHRTLFDNVRRLGRWPARI